MDSGALKKIYIWGTGCEAEKCIANIDFENCVIMGFIETKPNKDIWKGKEVYASESLPKLSYDYVVIANTYYKEILDDVKRRKLVDERKIINWMKVKECVYHCKGKAWKLFSSDKSGKEKKLQSKLKNYKKIYVYDIRLINCYLDINVLIREIIDNLRDSETGMAFIPNEDYLNESWYHNLLYVLDRNAFVIWKELEGAYAEYIWDNVEQFSFEKFNILQFVIQQKRLCNKSKYMFYNMKLVYEEKKQFISNADKIKIFTLRSDRIGEQIRQINQLMCQKQEEANVFKLYIPISEYGRPFEGVNTCFNEIVSRTFNLLSNREEYSLWIQDIFARRDKYEYAGVIKLYNIGNGINMDMTHPVLKFDEYERELGKILIESEMGIKGDYVCLFTRDAKFLNSIAPDREENHFAHHNYRDATFDIMNKAIDYFNSCGIQTVRMGQIAENVEMHGNCIDFANQNYDEFLDLMLHYYSKFFIGSVAGISMIPTFFNRPIVSLITYYPCIEHNVDGKKEDLCIFNRIYDSNKGRELSLLEIFDNAYRLVIESGCRGEHFARHGLKIIPFSQTDIWEVAKEMNEKLDCVWKYEDGDADLYERFNHKLDMFIEENHIDTSELWMPTIATSYLRRYKYLLED